MYFLASTDDESVKKACHSHSEPEMEEFVLGLSRRGRGRGRGSSRRKGTPEKIQARPSEAVSPTSGSVLRTASSPVLVVPSDDDGKRRGSRRAIGTTPSPGSVVGPETSPRPTVDSCSTSPPTNRPSKPTSYDVFEFREDEDESSDQTVPGKALDAATAPPSPFPDGCVNATTTEAAELKPATESCESGASLDPASVAAPEQVPPAHKEERQSHVDEVIEEVVRGRFIASEVQAALPHVVTSTPERHVMPQPPIVVSVGRPSMPQTKPLPSCGESDRVVVLVGGPGELNCWSCRFVTPAPMPTAGAKGDSSVRLLFPRSFVRPSVRSSVSPCSD